MSGPNCSCLRKQCDEAWHDHSTAVLMEEVTITVPRYALERAAYLAQLMDGAWSGPYRALAPYLLNPKPDPSTPMPLEDPAQKIAPMENPKKHDTRSDWPRHLREVRSKG